MHHTLKNLKKVSFKNHFTSKKKKGNFKNKSIIYFPYPENNNFKNKKRG
jgi:hypothetical protein